MKQRDLTRTDDFRSDAFERDDTADTDVQTLLDAEFGPDPTSPAARPGSSSATERTETSVRGQRVVDHQTETQAAPVLCDLRYETRMEANLYISRTLLAEPRCRILVAGRIVTIERGEDDTFAAFDPDGRALAVDTQVPLLLIALLEQARV